MYPQREMFALSPLALVAVEIRFTDAARMRQQQTKDAIAIALEHRFPFAEPLQQTEFNLLPAGPPQIEQRAGVVLKNTKSTESLTLMSQSISYETTEYASFDPLLEAIAAACDALKESGVRPALQRIGLRYIDEIRVPGDISDVRDWKTWIDERLMSSLSIGPAEAIITSAQGLNTYDLGGGRGMNFRYAALNQAPVVAPTHLRRRAIESGPFFVLDFDGFQDFTGGDPVELETDVVRASLQAVHVPCGTTFQQSITEEARSLFRGEQ